MDFVLLLMAHGLRHGLFKDGKSLDDILSAAMSRGDQVLRWKDPTLPLFAKILPNVGRISIHEAATTNQARYTFTRMADYAGIIGQLVTHDIRRGCAKDLARLNQDLMRVA